MRVSIAEAARRLGVSEVTVRRRLRAGELPGIREGIPGGFRWLVEIEEQPEARPAVAPEQLAALVAEVDRLRAERDAARAEASRLVEVVHALATGSQHGPALPEPAAPEHPERPEPGRWARLWRWLERG